MIWPLEPWNFQQFQHHRQYLISIFWRRWRLWWHYWRYKWFEWGKNSSIKLGWSEDSRKGCELNLYKELKTLLWTRTQINVVHKYSCKYAQKTRQVPWMPLPNKSCFSMQGSWCHCWRLQLSWSYIPWWLCGI